MTNVNSFLSFVSADGSSSNMPTAAGNWEKSKDVLLESVEIEETILLTRVNELTHLKELCQMAQSEIDQQQQREKEEEEQKVKEAEKATGKENTKPSVASEIGVSVENYRNHQYENKLKKTYLFNQVNVDLLEKNKTLESQLEKMELREKALEKVRINFF
jgi:hypothetical protein